MLLWNMFAVKNPRACLAKTSFIPIIGTKFEHDDSLQFKCVFSSISNTKYALTAEYNNMILAVCCSVIDNQITIKYGNNKPIQKEIIDFLEQ